MTNSFERPGLVPAYDLWLRLVNCVISLLHRHRHTAIPTARRGRAGQHTGAAELSALILATLFDVGSCQAFGGLQCTMVVVHIPTPAPAHDDALARPAPSRLQIDHAHSVKVNACISFTGCINSSYGPLGIQHHKYLQPPSGQAAYCTPSTNMHGRWHCRPLHPLTACSPHGTATTT